MNTHMETKGSEKKTYEVPQLDVLGALEDITHGGADGGSLDADYSAGTPRGELTFS